MARFWKVLIVAPLALAVLLPAAFTLAGCGDETTTTGGMATTGAGNMMADRALKVLITTPTSGEYVANMITGTELAKKLADSNEKSQLFLLDIRKKEDYEKRHIAGTTQVEFTEWATDANLSKYPKDKKIIVICYTGNTAAQAVSVMRMLGYDAVSLKAGMEGWAASDPEGTAKYLREPNKPVVNTPSPETFQGAPTGAVFDKPDDADYKQLAEKANAVFSQKTSGTEYGLNTINSNKLSAKLNDPNEKSKVYLLDLRKKEDYEKVGH
ncbi:MAG: rhodanese-like domain-containing protein, partial [Actinomycetota bacterium]